ncbi:hypothetical protein [Bradyrhizobium sp. AZCC 1699]|uniref:hypothetical protein n=1 Tax=Bradyrhizobium sp. AZCC 1699 TaxID=3117024 RepID=UPI002FF14BE0
MTSTNNMLISNGLLDGGALVSGPESDVTDEFLNDLDIEAILGVNTTPKEVQNSAQSAPLPPTKP